MNEKSEVIDDMSLSRHLQAGLDQGRAVLTVMYLCVLAVCFLTPIIYYCRLHLEERNSRRLRQMEIASIRAAMEQSQSAGDSQHGGGGDAQSRAVQRKYIEERRARILQLFAPVRMVLIEENFPHLREDQVLTNVKDDKDYEAHECKIDELNELEHVETGYKNSVTSDGASQSGHHKDDEHRLETTTTPPVCYDEDEDPHEDDETIMIEIPVPGLFLNENSGEEPEKRLAPGVCTICLTRYEVGSCVVWSSNSACKHVFHDECIEKWIMSQREGPLCPCCRRDFIIDPFDVDVEEGRADESPSDAVQSTTTGGDDGEEES